MSKPGRWLIRPFDKLRAKVDRSQEIAEHREILSSCRSIFGVFLSSPGDVADERRIARKAIDAVARRTLLRGG